MKWTCIQLGNIADVLPGYAFKSADMGSVGFPVVRIGDIDETGRVDGESALKIPETLIEKRHTKYFLTRGDIVLSMTGEGKLGMVVSDQPLLLNQRVALIRARKPEDQKFLWFALGTANYATSFSQLAAGAAQQNISGGQLENMSLPYPPSNVRVRIAGILSAYDDLIENNRRRMKLLEEAARQLYREWFVRLRFPGHERGKIKDGLPEGWEYHVLDGLCAIGRGASPRPIAAFMGGEVPWFKIGDATASESPFIFHTAEHVTDEGAKKSIILDPGSLILSNSATCGIPYFTAVSGCVHDGWLHFSQFNRISPQFLYCFLHHKRQELVSSVCDGSTQKNLNTSAVGRLKLVLPQNESIMRQFNDSASPLFAMIQTLAMQSQKLRAARDLLLPTLMSGEVAV